jgi:hypothetical protein
MSNNLTLKSVIDFASTFIRMAPLVNAGGVANQPGLDLCNDVLQSLLSSPYDWKFNKSAILPFTTIPYQQDYLISGCQMSIVTSGVPPVNVCLVHLNAVNSASGAGLTASGTVATANFSDFAPNGTFGLNGPPGSTPVTTGSSVPQIGNLVTIVGAAQAAFNVTNAVITGLIKSPNGGITGVTFNVAVSGLIPDGGQGIGDVNWISHCSMQDYMNTGTVRPIGDIEVVSTLYLDSMIQTPFKACLLNENLTSPTLTTLTMRVWPLPSSQIWNLFFFYQQKAPIKTSLLNNWAPWPDNLGYVLRSGIKWAALDFFEDPRAPMAMQKWMLDIGKALDIKDQELRGESFFPSRPMMLGG